MPNAQDVEKVFYVVLQIHPEGLKIKGRFSVRPEPIEG